MKSDKCQLSFCGVGGHHAGAEEVSEGAGARPTQVWARTAIILVAPVLWTPDYVRIRAMSEASCESESVIWMGYATCAMQHAIQDRQDKHAEGA